MASWRHDFLTGHEQRRRFITAFEGQVPDGRLVGREADYSLRQGLVRASSDHPAAMAYGSAPPIMFRPAKGGIHMAAFGAEASEVLESYSPSIKKRLAAQFGRIEKSTLETGNLVARAADNMVSYDCGAMVVKKLDHPGQHVIGQEYTLQQMSREIQRSVAGGIVSRCAALEIDDPNLNAAIPAGLENQIVILGGVPLVARPGNSAGPLCIVIQRLRFACPLLLKGYWEGGHYRSFGYGTFVRSRPEALSDLPRRVAA